MPWRTRKRVLQSLRDDEAGRFIASLELDDEEPSAEEAALLEARRRRRYEHRAGPQEAGQRIAR